MKQKFLLTFILLFTSLILARPVGAADNRAQKVAAYLSKYNSPLAYYASDFVAEADKNRLDYRLLVAISGVESTFARNYILGTYNVYGWGGGEIYFKSWPDGIARVSEGIRRGYLDKGAKEIDQIARIYNPPTPTSWATKVRNFMEKIEATDPSILVAPPSASIPLPLTI